MLLISLVLVLCQARAEITATSFMTLAPNLSMSPDAGAFFNNLLMAIQTGASQAGVPGTPSEVSFLQGPEASISLDRMISTDYHSWGPEVNPPAPYSSQYGGSLLLGVCIDGNGERFLPQSIRLTQVSTDPYDLFSYTVTGTISYWSTYVRGMTYDIKNGTENWLTSGSVTEVPKAMILYAISVVPGETTGTPEQIQNRTLSDWEQGFYITPEWKVGGTTESGNPFQIILPADNIQIVPEPSIITLFLAGLGIIVFVKFARRNESG